MNEHTFKLQNGSTIFIKKDEIDWYGSINGGTVFYMKNGDSHRVTEDFLTVDKIFSTT